MATKQKTTSRVRKLDYKSKKKAVRQSESIASSVRLMRNALSHIWRNKKLFGGILLIYVILYALLVKGLATDFQLDQVRTQLEESTAGELNVLDTGAVLFGTLIGTANTASSETGALYQTVLFLVMSLATIWALRQTFESKKKLSVRDVFYGSMYPLIPYLFVWLAVLLQLIPALIGSFIYSIVVSNGIAVGTFEQVLWLILLLASIGLSVFFISSSLFATYIVTLPDMRPMTALKKAKSLVKFRRFLIIRKLLFLPLTILVIFGLLFFPLVLYAAVVAEILFLVLSLALLIVFHAYVYQLYREMI